MSVEVRKLNGHGYDVGHRRAGYWESIILTKDEMFEFHRWLSDHLAEMLLDGWRPPGMPDE